MFVAKSLGKHQLSWIALMWKDRLGLVAVLGQGSSGQHLLAFSICSQAVLGKRRDLARAPGRGQVACNGVQDLWNLLEQCDDANSSLCLEKGIEEKNLPFAVCTQTWNVLRTYTAMEQITSFYLFVFS